MPHLNLPKKLHPDFRLPDRKPLSPVVLDRSHPLAKNLAYYFIWINGQPYDLVSERLVTLSSSTSGNFALKYGSEGPVMDHTARVETDNTNFNPFQTLGTGDFTILSKFNLDKTAGQQTLICSRVGFNNNHIELRLNQASQGNITFYATATSVSLSGANFENGWNTAGAKRENNNHIVYLNGVNNNSGGATATNFGGSPTFVFGGLPGSSSVQYTGDRSYDVAWYRGLEDHEVKSFNDDPYQVLKPATPISYFYSAAAATTKFLTLPKKLHPDFSEKDKIPLGKVEIDRSNPLGESVLRCWLPRGSYFEELSTGIPQPTTQNPSNGTAAYNKRGPYMQCTDPHEIAVTNKFFAATDSYTISWLASKDSETSGEGMVCGDLGSTQNFIWQSNTAASLSIRRSNTTRTMTLSSVNHTDHVWRTVVFSYNGTDTDITYYAKGDSTSASQLAKAFAINGITCGYSGAGFDYQGKFQGLIVHNRALSAGEVLDLHADPYQILRPATPILYSYGAAGGPASYTLTANADSYALTGQTVTLAADRALVSDSGSYTLTGQTAGLAYGRMTTADSGTFTVNGQTAALTAARALAFDSGSFSLTGQSAAFKRGFALASDSGSYALTGQSVNWLRTYVSSAGSFTLTGIDATLSYSATASVQPALFTFYSQQQPIEIQSKIRPFEIHSTAKKFEIYR